MLKKLTALLLCVLLGVAPALAEGGKVLDGRWLCADLQGNVTEDTPAELKDDFGLYVNKEWILQAQIPDGEVSTGSLENVSRELKDRQIALMKDESLTGHDAELVHKLYALASDWDYRNALGLEPIRPAMEALAAIGSLQDVYDYSFAEDTLLPFFAVNIAVGINPRDSGVNITQIAPASLMLSDSAEYAQRSASGEITYTVDIRRGEYMLERLGMSAEEAGAVFENAFAFDTLLSAHIRPVSDRYQPGYMDSIANYYTPEELAELAGGFPILDVIRGEGLPIGKSFLVTEPAFIASLKELYTEENVPLIRDWMRVRTVLTVWDMLDEETYRQGQAIGNEVKGITGETSAEDYALSVVTTYLKAPMDNLYIRAYCTAQQRQDILDIIDDVLAMYHTMLEDTDWLGEETRRQAVEKLDSIRVFAVYPDQLSENSGLDFPGREENGNLLLVSKAYRQYTRMRQAAMVDGPVNRDEWDQWATPTSVCNAYYSPQKNAITILAGFLGGENYREDMTYEQKLGGIGCTIGHEISHAFDTNGAQYDKDGALRNWWTNEDYAQFLARADKLSAWYDGFIPMEGAKYSGKQVRTEVIADMAGMKCVLAIAAQAEEFDYDLFFRQYAKVWRTVMLPSRIIYLIAADTHPMRYMRVNANVAQFDEFIICYDIQPGDGMYIAPEDRVLVW